MRWLPPNSGLSSFPVLALHISSFHGRETLRHGRVIRRRFAAWVELMKERDDVRHLLRRQDKARHITVTDLKTLQERRPQSVDRILPVEIAKRWREHVGTRRSEEHTSELQSLMRISYAVFCLKKKKQTEPR